MDENQTQTITDEVDGVVEAVPIELVTEGEEDFYLEAGEMEEFMGFQQVPEPTSSDITLSGVLLVILLATVALTGWYAWRAIKANCFMTAGLLGILFVLFQVFVFQSFSYLLAPGATMYLEGQTAYYVFSAFVIPVVLIASLGSVVYGVFQMERR
jgi:hypothetical protein